MTLSVRLSALQSRIEKIRGIVMSKAWTDEARIASAKARAHAKEAENASGEKADHHRRMVQVNEKKSKYYSMRDQGHSHEYSLRSAARESGAGSKMSTRELNRWLD